MMQQSVELPWLFRDLRGQSKFPDGEESPRVAKVQRRLLAVQPIGA
jgi:hypothetical protein